MLGVLDGDIILRAPENPLSTEAVPIRWDGWVYFKSLIIRHYSKDILRYRDKVPCGSTGQPAVFGFTETSRVLAGYHLGIDIRLGAVDFGDILIVGGGNLGIIFKRLVAVTHEGFGADYPGVVVAEDSRVFLVAAGVGRNLAVFNIIAAVGGIVEDKAVLAVQVLVDA